MKVYAVAELCLVSGRNEYELDTESEPVICKSLVFLNRKDASTRVQELNKKDDLPTGEKRWVVVIIPIHPNTNQNINNKPNK